MSIAPYIRVIGRGKDGARALDETQALDLMRQLLDGRLSDLEVGAFALAMRIKGETVAELSGFLGAVHERCIAVACERPALLLPSYNGARRLPNLTPLLAWQLARAGVPVLVHGVRRDAGRVTSAEVFEALGLPLAHDASMVRAAWQRDEPAFIDIARLCPPLARLLAVRQVVGLRNSGHTLAKLLAPVQGAPNLRVVNHTHPEYAIVLGQFLARSGAHAMLLRGTEGEPVADARRRPRMDVFIAGERHAALSCEAQEGSLTTLPDMPAGQDAAATAAYIQGVLSARKPLPAPIAQQADALLRALAALA